MDLDPRLWCAWEGPKSLSGPRTKNTGGGASIDSAESLPSAGVKAIPPWHCPGVLPNDGPRKGNVPAQFFPDRRNGTAGKKSVSLAEEGNLSDSFSLFHSRFPWSPRDT